MSAMPTFMGYFNGEQVGAPRFNRAGERAHPAAKHRRSQTSVSELNWAASILGCIVDMTTHIVQGLAPIVPGASIFVQLHDRIRGS